MIYDVNSPLFRSFLSQKGGSSDKRKTEEQRPKEHKPKANENKPVMNEFTKCADTIPPVPFLSCLPSPPMTVPHPHRLIWLNLKYKITNLFKVMTPVLVDGRRLLSLSPHDSSNGSLLLA
ncbi:hypothetical protein M8C21_007695 [Ambrosia artemisiifolia]|nr:hypothetical protein M8C21_007695 [Ambrosia artemisiifolia]